MNLYVLVTNRIRFDRFFGICLVVVCLALLAMFSPLILTWLWPEQTYWITIAWANALSALIVAGVIGGVFFLALGNLQTRVGVFLKYFRFPPFPPKTFLEHLDHWNENVPRSTREYLLKYLVSHGYLSQDGDIFTLTECGEALLGNMEEVGVLSGPC